MTTKKLGGLTRLAVIVAVLTAGSEIARTQEKVMQRTVTVSASGEVSVRPDMARVSAGVTSEGTTAREALDKNTAAMAKLIAGLKSAGVEAADIQTSNINVQPRYTNPREGQVAVINGYTVSNTVDILARDLKRLGELLDGLIGLGANQMHGLSFEVSEAETLRDEARKAAIANARRRAELYAAAAGAKVGEVLAISEDTIHPAPRPYAMVRKAGAEVMPIEPGSETLEARVSVTWALN